MPNEPTIAPHTKRMRLRYDGVCRSCAASVPAGQAAEYDRGTRTVRCLDCAQQARTSELPAPEVGVVAHAVDRGPWPAAPTQPSIVAGVAGGSARLEHERRVARREQRVRAQHPRLGGLILALTDDPQSTKAWATGAVGEEVLGRKLDVVTDSGARVLHDRRIPPTRANIDHIVVSAAGVFVIDAKRYKGRRPQLRVEGGILRPRVEKLLVGTRYCTKLVDGVHKQVDVVRTALAFVGLPDDLPVVGMLCFIEADWPLFGGAFTVDGVSVLWPKRAVERITAPGTLGPAQVAAVHDVLARAFPPA